MNKYVILVSRGDGNNSFIEAETRAEIRTVVYDLQKESDTEHIRVVHIGSPEGVIYRWSNPNCCAE